NWFFDQWFLASNHPILDFKHAIDSTSNEIIVTVEQKQDLNEVPIYKLPIDVAVFDNDGKKVHRIVVDKVKQEFRLPFTGSVKNIIFDNQQMLLAKKTETKGNPWYIHQYYNG